MGGNICISHELRVNIQNIERTHIAVWVTLGQRIWIDIFPKKTYQQVCEKMLTVSLIIKAKPQWGITSYLLEWLLSKMKEITCWWERGKKGTLVLYWWERELVQLQYRDSSWSSNFISKHLSKENKATNLKRCIYNSQDVEATCVYH